MNNVSEMTHQTDYDPWVS